MRICNTYSSQYYGYSEALSLKVMPSTASEHTAGAYSTERKPQARKLSNLVLHPAQIQQRQFQNDTNLALSQLKLSGRWTTVLITRFPGRSLGSGSSGESWTIVGPVSVGARHGLSESAGKELSRRSMAFSAEPFERPFVYRIIAIGTVLVFQIPMPARSIEAG